MHQTTETTCSDTERTVICIRRTGKYVPPVKVKKVRTPKRAPARTSPRCAARTAPGFFKETALARRAHKMEVSVKPIEKGKKKETPMICWK